METKPANSIFRQVLFGGLWTLGLRLSGRALGFVRSIVLARLLFPADFGLIAMAMIVVTGLECISQTGLQQALIQKKSDIEKCLDTAWAVALARNLVLCLTQVLPPPWLRDSSRPPGSQTSSGSSPCRFCSAVLRYHFTASA